MDEKNDFFTDYDSAQCELEQISEMLWYVYEDYYSSTKEDIYTKANYYDRVGVFIYNIQNSLLNLSKEMAEKINARPKNKLVKDQVIAPGAEVKNGIYVENGVKHIRMGWENDFVKGVILSDGTILQNMQCNLNAKIPTDEELKAIDEKNYKPRWEEKENG